MSLILDEYKYVRYCRKCHEYYRTPSRRSTICLECNTGYSYVLRKQRLDAIQADVPKDKRVRV